VRAARDRGAIVIMIAHRPSVMAVADKMMILEHGAIKQFGPRTQVIEMIGAGEAQDRRKRIRAVPAQGAE